MAYIEAQFSFQRQDFTLSVDFSCQQEEILGIQGPMGVGKSTLFHCLAGLLQPQQGFLDLGQTSYIHAEKKIWVPPQERRIAYLFQEDRLFTHLSVYANLVYSLGSRQKRSLHAKQVEDLIELLGLRKLLRQKAFKLSGGEKRRLALGRTLLSDFDLLLLDEPFRSLSPLLEQEIIHYLRGQKGISILFTSHADETLRQFSQKIVSMPYGQCVYKTELTKQDNQNEK